jgi:hypothetical protein
MPNASVPIGETAESVTDKQQPLPELPERIGTPAVSWGYDEGYLTTSVTLSINGEDRTASFWDDEEYGICSTAEDTFGTEDTTIWEDLDPLDNAAIHRWGRAVHARLLDAAGGLGDSAAPEGSEAHSAVTAFITGN